VFVALGIQHAMRMRHIILGLPNLQIFPYYLINVTIFEKKKVTENEMCVSSFSAPLSEIFFILRRIEQDMIEKVFWSSRKVPVIIVRF
jgi:hypothetical protein